MRNKTDHGQEIREILHNSETPVVEINSYIEKQLRISDKWWLAVCALSFLGFIYVLYHNEPSRKEVVKEARILVDSMRIEYQAKLDFKLDSMYQFMSAPNHGSCITKK